MLQNDNNDDIWKPLKIPQCFSESIAKCTGTKNNPIEAQKKESGFLLYTISYSQNKFFHPSLLKFIQFTGFKIIHSLLVLKLALMNGHLRPVTLIVSTKIKLG